MTSGSEARIVARLRAAGCVFAEDEARLLVESVAAPGELERAVARRVAGEPLEQVLGWAEFCGLRVAVEPGVFVPRRRSEFLAQQAIALTQPGDVVVELCCGTGAISAAIRSAVPDVDLHATDIDAVAVHCARRNLPGAAVHLGDLDAPLPTELRGAVDVVVANAPYVPTDAIALMPPEARLHEPQTALDGGADGLDLARRVCAAAPRWLAPGGHLLVETSERQAPALRAATTDAGLEARIVRSDEDDATVVVASRRASSGAIIEAS